MNIYLYKISEKIHCVFVIDWCEVIDRLDFESFIHAIIQLGSISVPKHVGIASRLQHDASLGPGPGVISADSVN